MNLFAFIKKYLQGTYTYFIYLFILLLFSFLNSILWGTKNNLHYQVYNKTLATVCWKTPIFQSKQAITKQHHISLNIQFTVVLNGITCFSARFCDNSLLVLKMPFQLFSFASKKVQGSSSDIDVVVISDLTINYKTVSQFFEILILSQDICGNVHYVSEINQLW